MVCLINFVHFMVAAVQLYC